MNKKILVLSVALLLAAASVLFIYKSITTSETTEAPQTPNIGVDLKSPLLLDSAKKDLLQNKAESAIKSLEAFISRNPDSSRAESAYLMLGAAYEANRDLLKAREAYQKVMEKFAASNGIVKAQEAIDNLNIRILFSRIVTKDSLIYEVQKGNSLSRIARKFGTTVDLIIRANDLKDNNVRVGQKLKITKSKFSIIVDKSQNILILKADNDIVKTYRVSTGKNSSTPIGNFKITNKIVDPIWYTAGAAIPPNSPKNILGSRWMGISAKGYGMHGTTEPQSIGRSVTAGCVRMANPDVEELYVIVPEGTEVIIID